MFYWALGFWFCLGAGVATGQSQTLIKAPAGIIQGYTETINVNAQDTTLRKFDGIPYAEPPVGERRFAKPVQRAKLTPPFQATEPAPACFQSAFSVHPPGTSTFSEDCLVLNVISPERSGDELFPVMIWIHGGGFTSGSSYSFDVDYFSAIGGVIVVTVNYRLAQLGFLSTGDSAAPGNLGLWDQQLAIKWVHDNIQAFGGDVDRVTVFGQSAGAISLIYQVMHPGNAGLFQRAIAQSGTALSPWALYNKTMVIENTIDFASRLGCDQSASSDKITCLQQKTSDEIDETIKAYPYFVPWGPVFDEDFVVHDPAEFMAGSISGPARDTFDGIDLIIGCTNMDGLFNMYTWMWKLGQYDSANFVVSKEQFEDILVPHYTQLSYPFLSDPAATYVDVNGLVGFQYTDWTDAADDTKRLRQLAALATDVLFNVPSTGTADAHRTANKAATYMYRFSVKPESGRFFNFPNALDAPDAAGHMDELAFLFPGEDVNMASVSRQMIKWWTNFAKTGNPNDDTTTASEDPPQLGYGAGTTWQQYDSSEAYLNILPEGPIEQQRYAAEATAFFQDVVPELLDTDCTTQ